MSVPLIESQQSLADDLDRWVRDPRCRFAVRSRIQCRRCGEELGRLVDVAMDLEDGSGTLAVAPFAPVLSIRVFDSDRAQAVRLSREAGDGDARPGKRYPFDEFVVAFPNDAACPAELQLHCSRHGDRPLTVAQVMSAPRIRL